MTFSDRSKLVFKIESAGTRIENLINKLHLVVFDTVCLSTHFNALSMALDRGIIEPTNLPCQIKIYKQLAFTDFE